MNEHVTWPGPYPTTWVFHLDERTTHMSLVTTGPGWPPVMATPSTIRDQLASLPDVAGADAGVVGLLRVSDALMETSVIHYEFAAIAVEKAMQALELALRTMTAPPSDARLLVLIRRLVDEGRVTEERGRELDQLRKLRNRLVGHPQREAALPLVTVMGYLSFIRAAIVDLISGSSADEG